MPLLRQALYAQNINLYLAPTADARDSWLSLIRTIGIEGRCFVITSNMCVRDGPPPPATTHEPVFSPDEKQDTAMADQPDPQPTRRRTSFVTEEGFEIALPPSPTQTHRPSLRPKRRKSVFDEDGNEIVLCCRDEDDDADMASPTSTPPPSTRTWARTAAVARSHVPKPLTALNGHSKTGTAKNSSEDKFLCRGGSSIVSPFGDVLAGPQWEDDSGIIYVDVDFEDCIRGRLDLDAAGSYSRYVMLPSSLLSLALVCLVDVVYNLSLIANTHDTGTIHSSSPFRDWISRLCRINCYIRYYPVYPYYDMNLYLAIPGRSHSSHSNI